MSRRLESGTKSAAFAMEARRECAVPAATLSARPLAPIESIDHTHTRSRMLRRLRCVCAAVWRPTERWRICKWRCCHPGGSNRGRPPASCQSAAPVWRRAIVLAGLLCVPNPAAARPCSDAQTPACAPGSLGRPVSRASEQGRRHSFWPARARPRYATTRLARRAGLLRGVSVVFRPSGADD
jgi:hypothetical protein